MIEIDGVKIPLPPNDLQAERRFLAAILVDNSQWEKSGCVNLGDDLFFHPTLRKIFGVMRTLLTQAGEADLLTVNSMCKSMYDCNGDTFPLTLVWILEATQIQDPPVNPTIDLERLLFIQRQRSKYAEIFKNNSTEFSEVCEEVKPST